MAGYVSERVINGWEKRLGDALDAMLREAHSTAMGLVGKPDTVVVAAWNGDFFQLIDIKWWRARVKRRLRPIIAESVLRTGINTAAAVGVRFDLENPLVAEAIDRQVAMLDQYGERLREHVGDTLQEAAHEGLSIPDTVKRMRESGEFSKAQATTVARTEIISASNDGAITAVRAAGSETHPFKRWLATDDDRTRLTHQRAHNQQVRLEDPFTVGSETCDHPGDTNLSGGERINCRCRVVFDRKQRA